MVFTHYKSMPLTIVHHCKMVTLNKPTSLKTTKGHKLLIGHKDHLDPISILLPKPTIQDGDTTLILAMATNTKPTHHNLLIDHLGLIHLGNFLTLIRPSHHNPMPPLLIPIPLLDMVKSMAISSSQFQHTTKASIKNL